MAIRLRMTLTADIVVEDYVEAAEAQVKMNAHLAELQRTYPNASLRIVQGRSRRGVVPAPQRRTRSITGRALTYET
jgi:hypothetical protein